MNNNTPLKISEHFIKITDPRVVGRVDHKLIDIITISLCAIISGAGNWPEIEAYGKAKYDWFKEFLELPNGIPTQHTFRRFFIAVSTDEFENCFLNWVKSVFKVSDSKVVPIDGKTLRRSHDRSSNKVAIHMVNAWCVENGISLGQVKTSEKSNEITAIPELIKSLELKGCIVTIDAMGCQTKISENIIDKGADYVLALKGNQSNLNKQVELFF
jgi:predicted transposase YbfD/YdcC